MISRTVDFRNEQETGFPAMLSYLLADPLVIRFEFHPPWQDSMPVWDVSREIVAEAFVGAVAAYDVRASTCDDEFRLGLFDVPTSTFVYQACDQRPIWEFLLATYELCPMCRCPAGRRCRECEIVRRDLKAWLAVFDLDRMGRQE